MLPDSKLLIPVLIVTFPLTPVAASPERRAIEPLDSPLPVLIFI